ncbi:malectin-B [Lingula anatina]|uniref:Malectin-B n=1 Tax=Lingula anatina TaxID=7574 RepID=A0A1S3IK20_LINAN|nr:malectin-B [Lingula anatina]|eukprot:XP_013398557.1 malectin-B [Lingula anatina]
MRTKTASACRRAWMSLIGFAGKFHSCLLFYLYRGRMQVLSIVKQRAVLWLVFLILQFIQVCGIGQVIWAVNCGGEAHTDINGIKYQKDMSKVGTPSDYGKSLLIQRVVPQDMILYQTERYHFSSFSYDIPLSGDGDYVLVLKFSEVWFAAPNQKVFNIVMNGQHTVVEDLDIFGKVGRGVAHDEVIPFIVKNGKIRVRGESSDISGKLKVEFAKGNYDNPKINAIYLMKGSLDDVPQLPPLPTPDKQQEEQEEEEEEEPERQKKPRRTSGPKIQDPYAGEDASTTMLPILAALGAFIPLVFCLCKL